MSLKRFSSLVALVVSYMLLFSGFVLLLIMGTSFKVIFFYGVGILVSLIVGVYEQLVKAGFIKASRKQVKIVYTLGLAIIATLLLLCTM